MDTLEWLNLIANHIEESAVLVCLRNQRHENGWQHKLSVEKRKLLAAILREGARSKVTTGTSGNSR